MAVGFLVLVLAFGVLPAFAAVPAEPVPKPVREILGRSCIACHSGDQAQAEVRLDGATVDWRSLESTALWERVYGAVASGSMPPLEAPGPSDAERSRLREWLENRLARHAVMGGAVPRRLNREEYRNSIRELFGMPEFTLPDSFPADDSMLGFDNVGEGLVVSPPLMAQYLDVATGVADWILPPRQETPDVESRHYPLDAAGFTTSGGGLVEGGAFRIVSTRNMANNAAWPDRFEASRSGVYRIAFDAMPFETEAMFYAPRTEPLRVSLYARPKAGEMYAPFGDLRKLATFEIVPGADAPQACSAEVELYRGETFGIRWDNGPVYSDPPRRDLSHTFLADRLTRDRLFYAAMLEFEGGPRGTTEVQAYEAMRALIDSRTLDLSDPRLDRLPEQWGGGLGSGPHNWIKAFVYQEMYRYGPAVDLTGLEVEGPLRLIEDKETRARIALTRRFLGVREVGAADLDHADAVLRRFLTRAFRRPASEEQVRSYVGLVESHMEAVRGARLEDGLHLEVRRALVSPRFLYRGLRPGRLDDFDLASRLSFFLTSSPPDQRLFDLAAAGELSDRSVLARETERLLASGRSDAFVSSFTGQWLSTRVLRGIMPDPRLLRFFDPDREAMIDETELFFAEIMRENLPLDTFIDPGFSYRSSRLNKIYGGDLEGVAMRRVTFEKGGPHGGILGLAAVMMATANGVDTHPVLRGVWLLDNVFGTPSPDPPPDVPAIAPDTSGATSMRAQLAAHRADRACARCHDSIDPLGTVLENYDPVGRWRDHYPVYTRPLDGTEALSEEYYSTVGKGSALGPPVDAAATLADGTHLGNALDLKRYVLDRLDVFSRCLAGKLLVYATGRPLGFRDSQSAAEIVASARANGNGFRDMIVAVTQSEAFATR